MSRQPRTLNLSLPRNAVPGSRRARAGGAAPTLAPHHDEVRTVTRMLWAAALGLALVAQGVHAQEKRGRGLVGALLGAGAVAAGAKAAAKTQSYGSTHLRPEQLKNCLNDAHHIDEGEEALGASAKKIKAEGQSIDAEQAALEKDGKKEFTEQAEVDRFNARVRSGKARVDAFNRELGTHKEKVAALDRGIEDFNRQCAGKKYYSSDLASIRGQLNFDPGKYAAK